MVTECVCDMCELDLDVTVILFIEPLHVKSSAENVITPSHTLFNMTNAKKLQSVELVKT